MPSKPPLSIKRPRSTATTPLIDDVAMAKMDRANAVAGGEKQTVKKKGTLLKRETRGERVTAYMPPELVTQLRAACQQPPRRSLSTALTEAASMWLQRDR